MEKIGIVILNYLNYQDTIECVNSILVMNYAVEGIVIVDNHSDNESFSVLHKTYHDNDNVIVVRTGKNYGFAKGNNIGIRIARRCLHVDFVFVANNDVVFTRQDYFEKMLRHYSEGVGVIGSEIHLSGDRVQKRHRIFITLKEYVVSYVGYYCLLHNNTVLAKRLPPIHRSVRVLHGCALLFTPDFFKYYEGFYEKTFLYYEENLLYLMCRKYGLMQKYVDDTYIFHKEDRSSEMSFHNDEIVEWKYSLQSCKYVIWWLIKEKICSSFKNIELKEEKR